MDFSEVCRQGIIVLANAPDQDGLIYDARQYAGGLRRGQEGPTLGGHHTWTNLAQANGWHVQRHNGLRSHFRVLDSSNRRHAWGSESEIRRFFEFMLEKANASKPKPSYSPPSATPAQTASVNVDDQVVPHQRGVADKSTSTGSFWRVDNTNIPAKSEDRMPTSAGQPKVIDRAPTPVRVEREPTHAGQLCLFIKDYHLPLTVGTKLYAAQIGGGYAATVTGEVIANKENPQQIGIRNLSDDEWIFSVHGDNKKSIRKGQVLYITGAIPGGELTVSFKGITGRIAVK
jgi:hypothetical protein